MSDANGDRTEAVSPTIENEVVLRGTPRIVFFVLTVIGFGAMAVFAAWWSILGGDRHPIPFVILSTIITVVLINNQGRWFLLPAMRRPIALLAAPDVRVAVVTTYVPSAEPEDMLAESLAALVAIDYPHDTWLLDEGDDPATKTLCVQLGVRHFSRKGLPKFQTDAGTFQRASKHGNYNAWLHQFGFEHYDVLVAFDPDHVPQPSYVTDIIGYFRDLRVGYVQVAQAFYNQDASLISRAAAEETYAYFSSVQMASYGLGYPIIVGSHHAHRMGALQAVGGMAAHDADDLLLTLKYRAAGWEGVYVPRILARGLAPVDWHGYLTQQRRWARSVLDIKLRRWDSYSGDLPFGSRIMSSLHGINFLHRSLVFLFSIGMLLHLLATGSTLGVFTMHLAVPTAVLLSVLHAQEMFRQRFYLGDSQERGFHWRVAVVDFAKWPWFLLALWDVLSRRKHGYVITRKTRQDRTFTKFVAWNLGLAALVAGAWMLGNRGGPINPFMSVAAATLVIVSVGLALDALRTPPPPYHPGLQRQKATALRPDAGSTTHLSRLPD